VNETTVVCVTCKGTRAKVSAPILSEHLVGAALVKAGWRRVMGGWRCPACIKKEEAHDITAPPLT
jgi:hypothetical protein